VNAGTHVRDDLTTDGRRGRTPTSGSPGPPGSDGSTGGRPADPDGPGAAPRWERPASITVCACFVLLLLLQAPGRTVTDTKFDLYADPVDLMRRATRLWDGRLAFGYVPNQQWGYLFPIGPVFALGRAIGAPTWLVQRAWLSGLLIVAFLGCRRLARELDIGTPLSRLLAATAYALAPSMLIHLAQTSAGIPLATAALPWIAVPLVRARRSHSTALAAVASAVAFAAGGSVNATVALSVLPFPALYLLLRERGPRRRSLIRWWVAAIGASSIVFVVGVALLRRYGFDFTRITEQAADTTASVNATDVMRGTSDWLAYFALGRPWSPAGQVFVHSFVVVLATGLLTALGVSGLARAELPERRCLGLTFGIGVVGQALAFQGVWAGPFAGRVQRLLDGPLSPLRNLSKLAPLVALPIAMGLAHQLGRIRRPRSRVLVPCGAAVLIACGSLPVMNGRLFAQGSYTDVPSYWRDAAAFLAQDPLARTLLTPSAPFGEYTWGRTLDEPLQSIGRAPWAARTLYPAGGALSSTRLLDVIDASVSRGEPVPGLASLLARSGVRFVLLRGDIDRGRSGSSEPTAVAAALDTTPGLSRLRSFGPVTASAGTADRLVPGLAAPIHAIEIYEVAGAPGLVSTMPASAVRLRGGLESLLDPHLAAAVGDRPVVVDDDGVDALPTDDVAISDALRLRDRNFGDARGALNASYALGANELPAGSTRLVPRDLTTPAESLSIAGDDQAHVVASSSFGTLTRFPEAQPYAAFDANPWTSWLPGPTRTDGTGEWIQVNFDRPRDVSGTSLRLLYDVPWRPLISQIRAVTDGGLAATQLLRTAATQTIAIPKGTTTFLRLEIMKVDGFPGGSSQVGISEVAVPGLSAHRPLIVPNAPAGSTASYFFARIPGPTFDPSRWSEEPTLDRLFTLSKAETYSIVATAGLRQPTSTSVIARYTGGGTTDATSSSSWFGRSAVGAVAAIDGNSGTAWVADPFDPTPTITVAWQQRQRISGINVVAAGAPVRTPTDVIVRAPGAADQRVALVDGHAALEPIRTDQVSVEVVGSTTPPGTASLVTPTAVGLQELTFDGATTTFDRNATPTLACGDGPTLRIDGAEVTTRPKGTVAQILSGGDVPLELCGDVPSSLGTGLHRISDSNSGPFSVSTVSLVAGDRPAAPTGKRSVEVGRWNDTERVLHLDAGPATVLSVAENANDGWVATFGGKELPSVELDGWHLGWVVPSGAAGDVHLTFRPSQTFRLGLFLWIGGVAGVLAAAWVATRRSTRPAPPMTERRLPVWLADGAAALALLLTGGIAVVMLPVLRRLRRDPVVLSVVCGIAFVFSAGVAAAEHHAAPGAASGAFSGLAQLSTLVALGGVLAAVALPNPPRDDPDRTGVDNTPKGTIP